MSKLLSDRMLETAASLRAIKHELVQLVRQGSWPEGSFRDISRVICEASFLADSLTRLADGTPSTPTPYDPAERR